MIRIGLIGVALAVLIAFVHGALMFVDGIVRAIKHDKERK
jgi:hypothetical protein